jgi:hypothetical protein
MKTVVSRISGGYEISAKFRTFARFLIKCVEILNRAICIHRTGKYITMFNLTCLMENVMYVGVGGKDNFASTQLEINPEKLV